MNKNIKKLNIYRNIHKEVLNEYHDLFNGAKVTDFNGKAKPYVEEAHKLIYMDRHEDLGTLAKYITDVQILQLGESWLKFVLHHLHNFMKGDNHNE